MSATLDSHMAPARRNAPVIQSGSIWSGPGIREFIVVFLPMRPTRRAFWRSSFIAGRRSGDLSSASKRPLREFEPDGQALQPVDEQGLRHPRLASEFDRLQPRQKLLVEYAHFHLGEVLAEAEMRAIAERKLLVRLAVRAEAIRLVKHRLVAIAGRIAKHQPITLGDCLTANLC